MEEIKPMDIQDYCKRTKNEILAHGTVSTYANDIAKEGLLIRNKDFPTVVFGDSFKENGNWYPIIDYTWHEPRANGEDCVVILEVPRETIEKIRSSGKKICQETVFDEICEDLQLSVPDTEDTRLAYEYKQKQLQNPSMSRLGDITEGLLGPKFCNYGAKPLSKYTHIGVPTKYIVAITSKDKVYYVSEKVKENILNSKKEKIKV